MMELAVFTHNTGPNTLGKVNTRGGKNFWCSRMTVRGRRPSWRHIRCAEEVTGDVP